MTPRRRSILFSVLPLLLACGAGTPPPPATANLAAPPPSEAPAQPTELEVACERGTAHIVAGLRAEMEITAYVTTGNPKLDAFVKALDELLASYERLAPGKIRYRRIEVTTDEQRVAAKEAGLQEIVLGGEARTTELRRGFLGIGFRYVSEIEAIPSLDPDQTSTLRFWIANEIREVRDRPDDAARHVAVLGGKSGVDIGEANLVPASGRGNGPSLKGVRAVRSP